MNDKTDKLKELKELDIKLIEKGREHVQQLCIISGALAAFLMPVYASKNFSLFQHTFITMSLCCFLISILVGLMWLSRKILEEQRAIAILIHILKTNDAKAAKEFDEKHNKSLEYRNSVDIKTLLVDILFSLGITFLIVAIICAENKLL